MRKAFFMAAWCAGAFCAATASSFESTPFIGGQDGYACYRAPAVVVSANGTVLAFCEGRVNNHKDEGDIDVVLKRSTDGGKNWSPLIVLENDGVNPCKNACPVVLPTGRILVVWLWNAAIPSEKHRSTRRVFVTFSDDDGMTWSTSRDITDAVYREDWRWYGAGPCHGIVKQRDPHKGRVLIPCRHNAKHVEMTSHVIYSDDDGETWCIGGSAPRERTNESTIAELSSGALMLNSRNGNKGSKEHRIVSISSDGGETFSRIYEDLALIEPGNGCFGSILAHSINENTGLANILFSNPNDGEERVNGTVKLSEDDGATWTKGYRYSRPAPAFSGYSDMALINGRDVALLYEKGDGYRESAREYAKGERYEAIGFQIIRFEDINLPIAGLAGYWPLTHNGLDGSGQGRHTINAGVVFDDAVPGGSPAARFDGISAFLEVPAELTPAFGTADFTLIADIFVPEPLDDGPGDILSCFDSDARRGWNLGIASYSGVSNSQPNYRNLFWGIDNAQLEHQWRDCGRPGNAVFIFGLAVHDGALYAATCEPGEGGAGHVYRYEGNAQWADCGSPDASNAVAGLAVYNGRLYAGASWYDTTGSALAPSPNTTPGGKIYRYEGGQSWTFCGALANPGTGEAATIGGLAVFQGALHATTLKKEGFGLYRYAGGVHWDYCGNPGRRVLNPCVFNGALYMVSYDAPGGPFRYDGKDFCYVGETIIPPIQQDYSFAVYGGLLHLSTWPEAHVYRRNAAGVWSLTGKPTGELETMGMMTYNGKLYAGSLPSARVYRLDGHQSWTPVGQVLDASDNKYRRAWSMALYQGRLFCGTLPSGKVFSIEAGRNATCDEPLGPGWHHLGAVRRNSQLSLYVDGRLAASSASFDPAAYDLSAGTPLRMGCGPGDYFHGWMREVRLYRRALSEQELLACCQQNGPL